MADNNILSQADYDLMGLDIPNRANLQRKNYLNYISNSKTTHPAWFFYAYNPNCNNCTIKIATVEHNRIQ